MLGEKLKFQTMFRCSGEQGQFKVRWVTLSGRRCHPVTGPEAFRCNPPPMKFVGFFRLLKKPPGVIRYSVSFTKEIPELLDRASKFGLEGLIGKRSGSKYEAGRRTGAWIKIKLHLEQEFVIGGYTKPEGSRKYFGALLVGFYEGKQLKFCGRVGTGFSEKLLRSLYSELNKIGIDKCPFYNLPAAGRNRWDQGLTAAEMKRCHWVKPVMVCQIKFTEWTRDDRLRQPVFLGIRLAVAEAEFNPLDWSYLSRRNLSNKGS
jgi:ATP-dependent DNA ligase